MKRLPAPIAQGNPSARQSNTSNHLSTARNSNAPYLDMELPNDRKTCLPDSLARLHVWR
jgi:hypothetical protein